jgi:gluconokinase
MLCDALGRDVGFPEGHQGSGFGAALLGMEALGVIDSFDRAAELIAVDEVRTPDPAASEVYASMLPIFDALYDALGPAFERLRALEGPAISPAR